MTPRKRRQIQPGVGVQPGDVNHTDAAIGGLGDELQIQDPDDAAVDQVQQDCEAVTGDAAARELDRQVVHRSEIIPGGIGVLFGHQQPPLKARCGGQTVRRPHLAGRPDGHRRPAR